MVLKPVPSGYRGMTVLGTIQLYCPVKTVGYTLWCQFSKYRLCKLGRSNCTRLMRPQVAWLRLEPVLTSKLVCVSLSGNLRKELYRAYESLETVCTTLFIGKDMIYLRKWSMDSIRFLQGL